MRRIIVAFAGAWALAALCAAAGADPDALERAVTADPENLSAAAAYRQRAIASRVFDRSIALFESLAKKKSSGPHVQISLALAYVDKVPTSGDIRRLYLGRDAMNALTRSIALRPTVFAYYTRGVINLFYNAFIFHRTDKGVADLTQALSMVDGDTPPALVLRVYTALGDGYSRLENLVKAREIWTAGLAKFPADAGLQTRTAAHGVDLEDVVTTALTASRRLDTSLDGVLPIR